MSRFSSTSGSFRSQNGHARTGSSGASPRPAGHAPAPRVQPGQYGHRPMPEPVTITYGPSEVGIVAVSDQAKVLRRLSPVSDTALMIAIGALHQHVGGGTNYAAGLEASLNLLEPVPAGRSRHIYFAADGVDNAGLEQLPAQVDRARRMGVRIYAIPIGSTQQHGAELFDYGRLREIAVATGGKVKPVSGFKELATEFETLAAKGGHHLGRSAAKICLIDVSGSMGTSWGDTTKIDAVKAAMFRFLQIELKRH